MIDVAQDAIQMLLDHPKGQGMIVRCYADTSMTGGFQWLWPQHLKNEASAIEQRLKDDPHARARFARDLKVIHGTDMVLKAIRATGVPASVIGEVCPPDEGMTIATSGRAEPLTQADRGEIARALEDG